MGGKTMSNITLKDELQAGLGKRKGEIFLLFDKDKTKADRFLATALNLYSNPALANCTADSIVDVCMSVAQINLSTNASLAQVYIYPYGNKATFQIGYKGWLSIFKRFGYDVRTDVVFDVDDFEWQIDSFEPRFSLKPNFELRQDDDTDWTFEHFGGVITQVRSRSGDEFKYFAHKNLIEKRRLNSPNQTTTNQKTSPDDKKRIDAKLPVGIWRQWYSEQAQAKAVKMLKNNLALEDDLMNIIKEDDIKESSMEEKPAKTAKKENNLNDALQDKKTINVEPELSSKEKVVLALTKRLIPKSRAVKWAENNVTDDNVESLMNDEAGLDAIAESLLG